MPLTTESSSALLAFSNGLAEAIAHAAPVVVAVNARHRMASSGIHWRSGYVVTADHTVKREDDITVTLSDGRMLPAQLVARDSGTDLAILQIQETNLPTAELADAASLKVGHIVLAIARSNEGNTSACMGVVSALSGTWRSWHGGQIDQFIRPDITPYPGFAGSPLVTVQGEIIGINTAGPRGAILTIPASTIDRVVNQLLQKGRIARGYLGLGMQPVQLPKTLQETLGLSHDGGVIVVSVEPDAPADRAGVLIGDILVALDQTPIRDVRDVHTMLDPDRVGKPLTAQIVRGGTLTEITITVGERPLKEAR
ncbi:trypsin-like peptidase domain-containing protein [Oscillatoria sp. FACHB-1407]|uniref:S1C family serine protease n=1 Tax=Oscillatoria sp. FACHB-1407 TaxID=2692847 RepID=UPI001686BD3B|nr:trypsin-like peptidase domain-containing protein [Oscillatoria sp. FACHB-1407]MBD2465446.1 trypsin-like peptidase domain-containing protein [Oscillatoria sp. FACHB-1407]